MKTKSQCMAELKELHMLYVELLIKNERRRADEVYQKIIVLNWLLDEIRENEVRDGKEIQPT